MSKPSATHKTALERPKQGGSYSRDPITGELTLIQQTQPKSAKKGK